MADYITQGTVQVVTALKAGTTDLEIKINPSQNYAIKHADKNYIVFINDANRDGMVFEVATKTWKIPVAETILVAALINAASNSANIEIEVDSTGDIIKSIKIPVIP